MPWFIAVDDPGLRVRLGDGREVVFRAAEYRTEEPAEIAALRSHPGVREAQGPGAAQATGEGGGFVVNPNTGEVHDLSRAGTRCHIPEDLEEAGWKHYKRLQDARRWTKADLCAWCFPDSRR